MLFSSALYLGRPSLLRDFDHRELAVRYSQCAVCTKIYPYFQEAKLLAITDATNRRCISLRQQSGLYLQTLMQVISPTG